MNKSGRKLIQKAQPDVVVIFAALFVSGLMLASLLPAGMHVALLVAASGCLILTLIEILSRYRLIFICLAALLSATFYGNLLAVPQADYSHFLKLEGSEGQLSGRFKGELKLSRSGNISFEMADTFYNAEQQRVSVPGKVVCNIKNPPFMPEPEQTYSLTGRFSVGSPGYPPVFHASQIENTSGTLSAYTLTGRMQRKLRDGLRSVLPARHAGIVIGFILGDTGQISTEDRKLFRETGISHLLAVSGQHIMVVIVFLAAILHWLKVPPVSRSIIIAIFLLVYALTTVGSPSVWRALIMYLCVAVVLHIEAYPSPVRPVAIAGLLILLLNPALIFNNAFQLSFAAVLSIIYLRGPIEQTLKKCYCPSLLARYLGVSLAANIGTLPMTALLFGTVSTSAILVNPLIIWSFSYILPVAFITAVLAIFWPSASIIIAPGLSLALDGILHILPSFQAIPGQFFYVGNIPGVVIACIYAGMLFLIARHNQSQINTLAPTADTEMSSSEQPVSKVSQSKTESSSRPENTGPAIPSDQLKPGESTVQKQQNPFRHSPTLSAMDEMLCECRRKPLKSLEKPKETLIPLSVLSIDSQNIYHQIIDLDRKSFAAEPERLLQSHIFLMALTGNEILNRISEHLDPPPTPGEIRIGQPVRDRYLATAVLAELILHSSILTRSKSDDFMMLISRGQTVYYRARRQLERILENNDFAESIEQHFQLRQDMLTWCSEFIEYDNSSRQLQNTRIRPEQ